ncbi:unnamed protein product [Chrysodeixis includens]|uniref:Uncharacterized protein n=1 Tax=Chrysodeixis includens TaxID=689277 RepID=A0A9P0BPA1_CHRIL|nr:unnamed protein product [Chrysodeixis includens]
MNLNFLENITFRKSKTKNMSEIHNISSDGSELDGSTNSLPNLSDEENITIIQNLQKQIEQLTTKLNSAQETIKNLSTENNELKSNLRELSSKLTPKQVPKKNSCKKKEKCLNSRNNTQNIEIVPTDTLAQKTQENPNITNTKTVTKGTPAKKKICIISSNKSNKVLSIAQEAFQDADICHYIYPECGVLQLISNLDTKLVNFSKNDYCVILIGENDFVKTNNYLKTVIEIRNVLSKIQHTNLILCLPTYKLSNYYSMFNCRVEAFGDLLCLDLNTHNYALLLDSNLELTCDYNMFSKHTGKLNNNGMKNIMYNLLKLINYNAKKCLQIDLDSENFIITPNSDFFLE